MHRSHRPIIWTLILGVVMALTACSGAPGTGPSTGPSEPATGIRVEHAYGTVELDRAPERVITLGLLETDVAVALGVTPVGVAKYFASEDGISPWLAPVLNGTPAIIDTTTQGSNGAELSLEEIAALDPDLIIATTYTQLDKYHDQLARIAPVLGPSEKNYLQLPWREQVTQIGAALGQVDQTAALIEKVDGQLSDAGTAHPELAGLDYTLSLGTPDQQFKVMNDPKGRECRTLQGVRTGLQQDRLRAARSG